MKAARLTSPIEARAVSSSDKARSKRLIWLSERTSRQGVAAGAPRPIQRIEQDPDRRWEPHQLALFSRPIKQERARRLQLLRKHRLLANRCAIGRSQFLVRIKNARDRAHVHREFADRFARDQ